MNHCYKNLIIFHEVVKHAVVKILENNEILDQLGYEFIKNSRDRSIKVYEKLKNGLVKSTRDNDKFKIFGNSRITNA